MVLFTKVGITVKKDNAFEKLIVNLLTEQTRTTPGLEVVPSSRPDSIHNLAFGKNESDLSHMMMTQLCTLSTYEGGCMKLLNWFNELMDTRISVQ